MEPHDALIKWNIIFLIYAELATITSTPSAEQPMPDDLRPETMAYLNDLHAEIFGLALSDAYKVFVVENRVYLDDNDEVTQNITTLSVLTIGADGVAPNILTPIYSLPLPYTLQNAATLGTIFSDINNFKDLSGFESLANGWSADKNLLITWDHGSAYGIFKLVLPGTGPQPTFSFVSKDDFNNLTNNEWTKKIGSIRQKVFTTQNPTYSYKKYITKQKEPNLIEFIGDISPSPAVPDQIFILTNAELASAITTGFMGDGVDLLVMFNCCMQNIHTNFALKDCVKVMVAPEGIISVPGYDYNAFISKIGTTPAISNNDLAAFILDSMEAKFNAENLQLLFQEHALFGIGLDNYQALFIDPLKCLAQDLIAYINLDPDNKGRIVKSRTPCYEMTLPLDYYLIDIVNWLGLLKARTNGAYNNTFNLQNFLANCTAAICCSKVGPPKSIYQIRGTYNEDFPPQGYAIYFPLNPKENSARSLTRTTFFNPNAPDPDFLPSTINWQSFLDLLYSS